MCGRWGSFFCFVVVFFFKMTLAWSQQSLFNVPSSTQTEKGRHFGQLQTNQNRLGRNVTNLTYDYGLFENAEVGLNVIGLSDAPADKGGASAEFLMNTQVFHRLSESWLLSSAMQAGVSEQKESTFYGFINAKRFFEEMNFDFIFGVFAANSDYIEARRGEVNFHCGIEARLMPDRLSLIVDYINGRSSLALSVIGVAYYYRPDFVISLGWQLPSFQSQNPTGAVLELTYY